MAVKRRLAFAAILFHGKLKFQAAGANTSVSPEISAVFSLLCYLCQVTFLLLPINMFTKRGILRCTVQK